MPGRRIAISFAVAAAAVAAPVPLAGESHTASVASCKRQQSSIYVTLDESRYPQTTDHWQDAVRAGRPSLLHIDRPEEDANRRAALAAHPPRSGYDRDEYPPAVSDEGGRGASVRYISPSDNRGAGATMGNQIEGWCNGQPFRVRYVP